MMTARRVLTWKYEDGDGGSDGDVGPAWIAGADAESEDVNGGEWLTRAQARGLAEQHGHDFVEDDGREDPTTARPHAEAVKAINRKLRRFGVSRDDLHLAAGHRDVVLMGAWYHRVDDEPLIPRDNPFGFRSGGASMSLDEALAKIRRLVPEWDTEPDPE
jgi:hypothetical protein